MRPDTADIIALLQERLRHRVSRVEAGARAAAFVAEKSRDRYEREQHQETHHQLRMSKRVLVPLLPHCDSFKCTVSYSEIFSRSSSEICCVRAFVRTHTKVK